MSRKKVVAVSGVFVVAVLSLFAGSTRGEESMWLTDFAKAKEKAKAEKKLILADFTGSDWCGWCIKLKSEVFDLPEFKDGAPKKFVLLEVDFPQKKELPKELKEQNDKMQKDFNIQGFPTILLLDAEGKMVAKTGYQEGGPAKYMASLDDFVKAHDAIVELTGKIATATGVDKAKLLDQLIEAQEKLGTDSGDAEKYAKEIVTLDADNKAGLKNKYTLKSLISEAEKLVEAGKFAEAKAAYEKALGSVGITDTQKQDIYFAEGGLCFQDKDFAGVVACLKKAREAAPTSPKSGQIDKMIASYEGIAQSQASVTKLKADAEKATGADKAKLLDQLIDAITKVAMGTQSRPTPGEIEGYSAEIIKLDADNKAGLKAKYETKAQIDTLMGDVFKAVRAEKFDEAEAGLKKALALPTLSPDQKAKLEKMLQQLQMMRPKDAPKAPATEEPKTK